MRRPSQSPVSSAASDASPRGAAGRASRPQATVASMRGLSSSVVARTTTTAQYYGGGEGAPLRRPSSNAASTASAAAAPPTMRQRSVPPPAVARQPRPVPMQMQQEPAPRAFLARSDVVDKQVRTLVSSCFPLSNELRASKSGRAALLSLGRRSTFSPLSLSLSLSKNSPRFAGHRQDLGPLPGRRRPHVHRL